MQGHEGYYSVIQYCPDRFRAEAANVGILLFSPKGPHVSAKISEQARRVKKMFSLSEVATSRVSRNAQAIQKRIDQLSGTVLTVDDLQHFIDTRANDIRITDPRLVKVQDWEADLNRLFEELVEQDEPEIAAKVTEPASSVLDQTFSRLIAEQRAFRPREVVVPLLRRPLDIPYAYQNGVLNLVKPMRFKGSDALDRASLLAMDGDLLRRHPEDGQERQLVVVSEGKQGSKRTKEAEEAIAPLFNEYHVRLVRSSDIEGFAAEVERSAH